MLPPVKAGGYLVNQTMKDRIINGPISPHASNLGALIAAAVAEPLGIPAYIYDAAMARKAAEKHRKKYEDMNFIVAHLGGGRSGSIPLLYIVDMCYSGQHDKKAMLLSKYSLVKMKLNRGG